MSPFCELMMRRRRLRDAISGDRIPVSDIGGSGPLRAVEGAIIDASPHMIALRTADSTEIRIPMCATASVWYGGPAGLAALRPGRHATVRPAGPGGIAVERIWVDITRVTGVIAGRSGPLIDIDRGPHRGTTTVTVPERALAPIQVRHPRLEPGALIDVIGVHHDGEILALLPATRSPQPGAAHAVPAGRPAGPPRLLSGTATWYDEADGVRGGAYPAVDPHDATSACGGTPGAHLPFLSVGSDIQVRNDCTDRVATLPVIACGCLAGRFADRCVRCGTSPRGRIIELTRAAFVDLGGDLEHGCFNATARVGRR